MVMMTVLTRNGGSLSHRKRLAERNPDAIQPAGREVRGVTRGCRSLAPAGGGCASLSGDTEAADSWEQAPHSTPMPSVASPTGVCVVRDREALVVGAAFSAKRASGAPSHGSTTEPGSRRRVKAAETVMRMLTSCARHWLAAACVDVGSCGCAAGASDSVVRRCAGSAWPAATKTGECVRVQPSCQPWVASTALIAARNASAAQTSLCARARADVATAQATPSCAAAGAGAHRRSICCRRHRTVVR